MRKLYTASMALFVAAFFIGCESPMEKNAKYQRPAGLAGKVYTVVEAQDDLSTFAECIERTKVDQLIDKSGLYTVMSPTNEAFAAYLADNGFNSIEDIDSVELKRLVEFHVVLMPWSKDQLRSLTFTGWVDPENPSSVALGYKRTTLLKNPNKHYNTSGGERTVFVSTNKYAPFFYSEYMSYYDLTSDDYQYYFDRPYSASELFYGGAQIVSDEIPAENGTVYKIDKVVEPMGNGEEFMQANQVGQSYSQFYNLIQSKAEFTYNISATQQQEGADLGEDIDSLYDISYPRVVLDIRDESTSTITESTVGYHHAIYAPENVAYEHFVNSVLLAPNHYTSMSRVPRFLTDMVVNAHLRPYYPYYKSLENTSYIINGIGDKVIIDESKVLERSYGSNCSFIGLSEVISPRALKGVSAPVLLRPNYSTYMWGMKSIALEQMLGRSGEDFIFYTIPNHILAEDSTLEVVWDDPQEETYDLISYDDDGEVVKLNNADVRNIYFTQIALSTPHGNARKEFIPNLNGSFIVIDNVNNTVSAGGGNEYVPTELTQENPDNGQVFTIDGWLNAPTLSLYNKLSSSGEFATLLEATGLLNPLTYSLTFQDLNHNYTVLAPTDEAFAAYDTTGLGMDGLKELLLRHIIKGDLLFTDKVKGATEYATESLTGHKISISLDYDAINILENDGSVFYTIEEDGDKTNAMTVEDIDASVEGLKYEVRGVYHQIDKVIEVQ